MYCLRVASHASLVGDGRTRRRRELLQKGRERMKNRAVLVCPVSLYQKKICWVVCGALLLVCVPDGEIRPMERGNSGGVKPCLAHADSLSLAGKWDGEQQVKYYLQGFQTADAYQSLSTVLFSFIAECCVSALYRSVHFLSWKPLKWIIPSECIYNLQSDVFLVYKKSWSYISQTKHRIMKWWCKFITMPKEMADYIITDYQD